MKKTGLKKYINTTVGVVVGLSACFANEAYATRLSYIVVQTESTPLHINNVNYGTSVAQVGLGVNAKDVAISNDGKYVYVALAPLVNGNPVESQIDVVDALTNKRITTIEKDSSGKKYLGIQALNIAISTDGKSLFTDSDLGVHKLTLGSDRKTVTNASTISPKYKKTTLEISRTGKYLISVGVDKTNPLATGISVIDPNSFVVISETQVSASAQGFTTNSDDTLLYITSLTDDTIYVYSIQSGQLSLVNSLAITAHTFTRCGPADVAIDDANKRLYVTCSGFGDDPKTSPSISSNQGGLISLNLVTLGQTPYKLKNEGEVYADAKGALHPWSIMYDATTSKIYLIKNKWGSPAGTFVSTIRVVPNGIDINSEYEYAVMERNNSYITGDFVGPECADCPSGLPNDPDGSGTFFRKGALDYFIFGTFIFVWIARRKYRFQ